MAWIYFQASEEAKTHFGNLSARLPIARLSGVHSAYYCVGCERVRLGRLRSGMTCAHCLAAISPHKLISSQEDSHARTSRLLEMELAWKESDRACSLKSSDSLASFFNENDYRRNHLHLSHLCHRHWPLSYFA